MAFAKPSVPFKLLNRVRSTSINNKEQLNTAEPTMLHDIHQGKKQCEMYCQEMKEAMHSKAWNQSVGIMDQVDHNPLVTSDNSIANNDIERVVSHKIQFLYDILKECLNTYQVNSLAHMYGEHNDTSSVYLELKTHSLAFTMEQSSHDTLLKYMRKIQINKLTHKSLCIIFALTVANRSGKRMQAYYYLSYSSMEGIGCTCGNYKALERVPYIFPCDITLHL
jgi:hypothetical protein